MSAPEHVAAQALLRWAASMAHPANGDESTAVFWTAWRHAGSLRELVVVRAHTALSAGRTAIEAEADAWDVLHHLEDRWRHEWRALAHKPAEAHEARLSAPSLAMAQRPAPPAPAPRLVQ